MIKKWFSTMDLLIWGIVVAIIIWVIIFNLKDFGNFLSKDLNWLLLNNTTLVKEEINWVWDFSYSTVFDTEADWTNAPALAWVLSQCWIAQSELKDNKETYSKNILVSLLWEWAEWNKRIESIVNLLNKLNQEWKLIFLFGDKDEAKWDKNFVNVETETERSKSWFFLLKSTPSPNKNSIAFGELSTTIFTTSYFDKPQPALIVSAICSSKESSFDKTAAIPPCAYKVLDSINLSFVNKATFPILDNKIASVSPAIPEPIIKKL